MTTEKIAATLFRVKRHQSDTSLEIDGSKEITQLPELPDDGLTGLYLRDNLKLSSLPTLPATLQALDIRRCPALTELPRLPVGLKKLFVDNLKLSSLPTLPATLQALEIRRCPALTELPRLPVGLEKLFVVGCPQFRQLGELPDGLKKLCVEDCQEMMELPNLPPGLATLLIFRNVSQLPKLPTSPHTLIECAKLLVVSRPTDSRSGSDEYAARG